MTSARAGSGADAGARARALGASLIALFLAAGGGLAHGQLIDRIEINPSAAAEVEIILRMNSNVQYLRHSPPAAGSELRIFMRLLGADIGGGIDREFRVSPPSSIGPRFRVSFPENDGSLLVSFEARTAYRVRQGRDSRSVSIFVPAIAAGDAGGTPAPQAGRDATGGGR